MQIISSFKQRGIFYLVSWGHRISGILLIGFLWFHIRTLELLTSPELYEAEASRYSGLVFAAMVVLLSLQVLFHAMNGGRLILYESFGMRNSEMLLALAFCLAFALVTAGIVLRVLVDVPISPFSFWIPVFIAGLAAAILMSLNLRRIPGTGTWKCQRITSGLLLVMVPAHLLFMHLHPDISHSAEVVIGRVQLGFMKILNTVFLASVIYHASFGLVSIASDYLPNGWVRRLLSLAIVLIAIKLGWDGLRLLWFL